MYPDKIPMISPCSPLQFIFLLVKSTSRSSRSPPLWRFSFCPADLPSGCILELENMTCAWYQWYLHHVDQWPWISCLNMARNKGFFACLLLKSLKSLICTVLAILFQLIIRSVSGWFMLYCVSLYGLFGGVLGFLWGWLLCLFEVFFCVYLGF